MAKIGNMWLGGKEPEAPNSEHFPSGIAFPVKCESKIDYIWESQDSHWQVELKQDHVHAVARSRDPQAYDSLVTSGLEQIQRCLDIIAVKKLVSVFRGAQISKRPFSRGFVKTQKEIKQLVQQVFCASSYEEDLRLGQELIARFIDRCCSAMEREKFWWY